MPSARRSQASTRNKSPQKVSSEALAKESHPEPTAQSVLDELRALGSESCKRTLLRHGAKEPLFGVRIGDMQPLRKRLGSQHQLALDLWDTGNSDARYLAGLIADAQAMTAAQLDAWARQADWSLMVSAVAGVAAESPHGFTRALRWIDDRRTGVVECGWTTLSNIVSVRPDEQLDLPKLRKLLQRVVTTLQQQPDRIRYTMNGFVIALGCSVKDLTDSCLVAADRIGPVEVDMGDTACEVPAARTYIQKVANRGTIGKKRRAARC